MDSAGPKMDDMAASQQLMDEGARAALATGGGGSKSSSTGRRIATGRKTRSTNKKTPSTRSRPIPSKQRALRKPQSYSLKDIQALADSDDASKSSLIVQTTHDNITPPRQEIEARDGTTSSSREVEVPDSQAAPPPEPSRTLMSPPLTSSIAVPASMSEDQTHKEAEDEAGTKSNRINSIPEHGISETQENTANGTSKSPSSSPSLSRRRLGRSYATPARGIAESEHSHASDLEPGANAMAASSAVTAGADMAATPSTHSRKQKSLARKIAVLDPIEDDDAPVGDEYINGLQERVGKKLQRVKKSNPGRSKKKSAVYCDMSDATQESVSEAANEAATVNDSKGRLEQTPKTTNSVWKERLKVSGKLSSVKNRKTRARGIELEASNSPAPARNVNEPHPNADLHELLPNEDKEANKVQRHAVEGEPLGNAPGDSQSTTKSQKKQKPITPCPDTPRRRFSRKSMADLSITAADRALNTVHDLPIKPDVRRSGEFTQDEDEIIRRAIQAYQQDRRLDTKDLVQIIEWTDQRLSNRACQKRSDWDEGEVQAAEESKEFWEEITQSLTRKLTRIKAHVRARYNNFKSGGWTEDDDERLRTLVEYHGHQWKLVADIMDDRSYHDVFNRWNDYLKHGDSRKTGPWSGDEEKLLLDAIKTVVQRDEDERAAAGHPRHKIYSNSDIKWKQVCTEMGDIRSRVQCTVKWARMTKRDSSISFQPVYKERKPQKSKVVDFSEDDGVATASTKKSRSKSKRIDSKTVKTPKNRQSKKSKDARANVVSEEVSGDEVLGGKVPATPFVSRPQSIVQPRTPGVAQMRWGDKFDLLEAVVGGSFENEEDIVWQTVLAHMGHHSWSVRILQAALKELLLLVPDQGNVTDTAFDVMEHLSEVCSPEALKEHFNQEDAYVMDASEDAEPGAEKDETATGHKQMAKRKRKRNTGDSLPGSGSAIAKRKKGGPTPTTRIGPRSTEFVYDSVDESAEQDV
jgi:hypothetical protein